MADLILTFKDENGVKRQLTVEETPLFTIGRGADNNLQIADNALSRRHVQIERFGNVFIVSDAGSSNGTKLNDLDLTAPSALKNGDRLLLGEAVEIAVEIANEFADYSSAGQNYYSSSTQSAAIGQESSGSFFQSIFFLAPVLGVVLLLVLVVAGLVLVNRGEKPPVAQQNLGAEEFPEEKPRPPRKDEADETDEDIKPRETPAPAAPNGDVKNQPSSPTATPILISSDEEKVEKFALQFLRDISGDSNAVLSSKQIALVNAKIKSLKNSAAFRENLKAVNGGKSAFEKIAEEHNFKTSFVAAAALAKLGESRGEPVGVGKTISPEIRNYANVLGLELSNDALLVIAAYSEGDAPNAIRDRIAALVKNTPNSTVTTVRTVWFLNENNKLKPASFDFVLRFIAAGTILQDPKSFGF